MQLPHIKDKIYIKMKENKFIRKTLLENNQIVCMTYKERVRDSGKSCKFVGVDLNTQRGQQENKKPHC